MSPRQGCSQQSQTSTQAQTGELGLILNPAHLIQDPVFSACDRRVEGVNPRLLLFWTHSQEDQIWCLQKREFRSVPGLTQRWALASVKMMRPLQKRQSRAEPPALFAPHSKAQDHPHPSLPCIPQDHPHPCPPPGPAAPGLAASGQAPHTVFPGCLEWARVNLLWFFLLLLLDFLSSSHFS